jgi:gamma-glutamyltranspeptidase/glutathione hydrolase
MTGSMPERTLRRAAAASESHVAQAARDALTRGNAMDAVVAGVLIAAAESPGVLLGPVQLLVGGAGAGLIAIDGRVRQPGLGAPRPRGFLASEAVPDAARVGVPALPGALATALASLGTLSLRRAARPAIEWARARSPERAQLIEAFARRGAPALAEDAVAGELTATAGRSARGLLTAEDLAAVRPDVVRCADDSLGPSGILGVPWRGGEALDASFTHVVAAADGRGMVAVACYEVPFDGVAVSALGIIAPRTAAPVLRGQMRVVPGKPRAAASPIALRAHRGIVNLAIGVATAQDAEDSLDALVAALATAVVIGETMNGVKSGRPVGVLCTPDAVRVLASA